MQTSDLKHCPICNFDLPVDEFGICRAPKDGRNLYCKSCIRQKVTASRRALKEYKETRKRYISQQLEIAEWDVGSDVSTVTSGAIVKLSPVDRVRLAIQRGARTQREIGHETKLGKDEIGDAIATLLLWTHEIRTQLVGNTRIYVLNVVQEKQIEVKRKPNVLGGFHTVSQLGPVIKGERRVWEVA